MSSAYQALADFLIGQRKKENGTFAKGDLVTAFGNNGVVKSISSNGMFLEVAFEDAPTTVVFTIDGKVHDWNARPSLEKR